MLMGKAEETQAALGYELAIYREQIAMIKRETERVSLTTIDLANALRTVEDMATEKVLIPIGGGALVKGSVNEMKVLVPIGAEYVVEMEKGEAESEIKRRVEVTRNAVEKLNEEFGKIVRKMQEITSQLQQLQSQSRISEQVEGNIHEDYI